MFLLVRSAEKSAANVCFFMHERVEWVQRKRKIYNLKNVCLTTQNWMPKIQPSIRKNKIKYFNWFVDPMQYSNYENI